MEPTGQRHRPNILLVRGALGDGSIWTEVIQNLQRKDYNVVASQLPLTSFTDDVRAVTRDLGALHGPTVVVGHSYGGFVITQAASAATNVASLVYVAAAAPDTGEVLRAYWRSTRHLPGHGTSCPWTRTRLHRSSSSSVTNSPSSSARTWGQGKPGH